MKKIIAWAGFSNDELFTTRENGSNCCIFSIYPTKKIAKLMYEDVRKVIIKVVE